MLAFCRCFCVFAVALFLWLLCSWLLLPLLAAVAVDVAVVVAAIAVDVAVVVAVVVVLT